MAARKIRRNASHARRGRAKNRRDAVRRKKDELLAGLAHELRTRLNAMLGWLQLLRNESLDPSQSEHAIEVVHRNAGEQVRLIDDALEASRITRRGVPSVREPVRPGALLDASLPILKEVTALVVDDHEDSSEILAALLERRGAQVLVAADAGAAFETLAKSAPDLLIADIAMPGIDGQELIRRVRDGGNTIPAIALSAAAHPDDRDRALRAGYDAYCTKPVDANELFRVIASLPGVR